jgi:hypothetical protein
VAWRVLITDSVDLSGLKDPVEDLGEVFDWAVKGPPCDRLRGVGLAVLYDDELRNGVRVRYFIGTYPHAYVAVVQVLPPLNPPS